MLNVFMLSVVILSVVVLSVVKLSVFMLNVVVLNVVAPKLLPICQWLLTTFFHLTITQFMRFFFYYFKIWSCNLLKKLLLADLRFKIYQKTVQNCIRALYHKPLRIRNLWRMDRFYCQYPVWYFTHLATLP